MRFWFSFFFLAVFISGPTHAAAATCSESDVIVSTTAAPPQKPSNLRTFMRKETEIPKDVDVILVGDSILANMPDSYAASAFPGMSVYNWGVHSDRTQNVLWRLERTGLAALKPKIVVLLIGVNNLTDGTAGCGIASGSIAIIERIRTLWPESRLILVDTLPYGWGYLDREEQRLVYNMEVENFVAGLKNTRAVNIDEQIACGPRHLPTYIEQRFPFWPFYVPCENFAGDSIHIVDSGYAILSQALKDAQNRD